MNTRLDLHELLCETLGSRNVYFQPPESIKMKYPAIVYSRRKPNNRYADNIIYRRLPGYELTVIDEDPDSEIVDKVSCLPMCAYDRNFASDNLNHTTFVIYY